MRPAPDVPATQRLVQQLRPLTSHALRPAIAGVGCLAVGAALPPSVVLDGPQLCVFKLLSGLPCPGCGLTRAVVLAMHGDFAGSLYFHPFGLLFVLAVAVLAAVDVYAWGIARQRGGRGLHPSWLLERLSQTPAPWVLIGGLLVLWAVRMPLYLLGTWVY